MRLKNQVLILLTAILTVNCAGSKIDAAQESETDLMRAAYQREAGEPVAVLVLGTFHFKGSSTDERSLGDLGMLSAERQEQIEDVLDLLAGFAPTKIAVEVNRGRQSELDERYADYLAGRYELTSNEVDQLALRLGKQLGVEKIYAIDARGRHFDNDIDGEKLAAETGQTTLLTDPVEAAWTSFQESMEKQALKAPLRDYLILRNNPDMLRMAHSIYLTRDRGITDGENYPIADGFVSRWYNRNIRIYGNIRALPTEPGERVLVVIGAGHVPILKHLIENSGALSFVEVSDVLGEVKK